MINNIIKNMNIAIVSESIIYYFYLIKIENNKIIRNVITRLNIIYY